MRILVMISLGVFALMDARGQATAPAQGGNAPQVVRPSGPPPPVGNQVPQPEPPRAIPPAPGTEPERAPGLPPGRATPIAPPPGQSLQNPAQNPAQGQNPNQPLQLVTNEFGEILTNAFAEPVNPNDTNRFAVATNRFPAIAQTNAFVQTNAFLARTQAIVFAMTNNLARMSSAQVTGIVQVQTSLTALQNAVVNLRDVPNVQQIIAENPALQQQVVELGTQIRVLARGTQPSADLINRLSQDLVIIVLPGTQLTADHQLVLSMVINQAVNASAFTPAQVESTADSAVVTLQSAGVPMARARLIRGDLHSIMAEVQQRQPEVRPTGAQ